MRSILRRRCACAAALATFVALSASLGYAGTYVLAPLPSAFSPVTATRVGTTETGTFSGLAGRVPLTGLPTAVSGAFGAPVDLVNFGGGGQAFSASSSSFFGSASTISGTYQFHPTVRSSGLPGNVLSTTAPINSNASTGNANPSFTMFGASVGPVFQASGAGVTSNNKPVAAPAPFATAASTGTIDFGQIDFIRGPQTSTVALNLFNASTDTTDLLSVPALIGNQADLTIKSLAITGPDAAWFTLDPTDVAALLGTALDPLTGLALDITFGFVPNALLGDKNALLTIVTDQYGALGGQNSTFAFALKGIATPEPGSVALWSLLGLAVAAGVVRRKRAGK